ncbi:hypothetical protein QQS21_003180 [Conoideocrella luteorostrata]|uniref:Aminotransferase class I/classII large domain-containing protein n=1 Tax=Conoideocrella luteorostrata TaxID=1105319 RepID=A0AAJ0CTS3_9HYPO|nr:hypothetical protein QQS21_003180 [Conoideocrella luteorostrata]
MVQFQHFNVEQWMDTYETTPGVLNVAETCCSSISIDELSRLSTHNDSPAAIPTSQRLTYGSIRGSVTLRQRVAELCSEEGRCGPTDDDVIITQGAISGNFLALYSLIGPGDHVVCVYPTYQQLYSVPASLGAEVSLWRLSDDAGYIPDLNDLEALVQNNTKASRLLTFERVLQHLFIEHNGADDHY